MVLTEKWKIYRFLKTNDLKLFERIFLKDLENNDYILLEKMTFYETT